MFKSKKKKSKGRRYSLFGKDDKKTTKIKKSKDDNKTSISTI